MATEIYETAEERGENWALWLGDSCERMAEIETDSVGLTVTSPPFVSLYTFSDSLRDLSNNHDAAVFHEHYGFIIRELLRVTMPGRIAAVHVTQLTRTKATHGYRGVHDFRGDVIRDHEAAGWVYHGEVCIWKNPQAQAIRTKSQDLMFVSLARDGALVRPAVADYVLFFKKPGDNPVPVKNDVSQDEWIEWASPIWLDNAVGVAPDGHLLPVWMDIRQTNTLNERLAKDESDERHISPLQLDLIERCVRLWSNPGEVVFDPFGGIGSTVYVAAKTGRRGLSIELKRAYWAESVRVLQGLDDEMNTPNLFDELGA